MGHNIFRGKEEQLELFPYNYVITISSGGQEIYADTPEQVWDAIDMASWSPYIVTSPVGLDCSEFIPY